MNNNLFVLLEIKDLKLRINVENLKFKGCEGGSIYIGVFENVEIVIDEVVNV